MSENYFGFLTFSVLTEALITYSNQIFVHGNIHWQVIIAIIIGIFVSISYKLDLLKQFKLESEIPYVGQIITGILISRGSNYIFDFIKNINLTPNRPILKLDCFYKVQGNRNVEIQSILVVCECYEYCIEDEIYKKNPVLG